MNRSRTAPACSNPYDARRTSCSRDRVESVDGVALPIDAGLLGLDRMLQLAFRRVVESGLPTSVSAAWAGPEAHYFFGGGSAAADSVLGGTMFFSRR